MLYIGIGSNLGNRERNIAVALEKIENSIGKIGAQSKIYETEPWGFESDNKFLNMAIEVTTTHSPETVLTTLQEIEIELGRDRKSSGGQYSSRPIDLDILLFDNLIIDTPTLKIPHPLLAQRLFVLKPLNDICPTLIHPILHKSIGELLSIIQNRLFSFEAISQE